VELSRAHTPGITARRRPAREIERHGLIVLPPPPHHSTQGVGGYGRRGARRPLPRQNGRRAQQWYVDRRRLYVDPSATTGYTLSDVIIAAIMGLILAFALAIASGLGILFAAGIVIGAVLIATRHKLWTGSGSRLR
jgi:hypothetical protein